MTSPSDAQLAVDAGADAIGLVFYPDSPRAVTLEQAAEIARAVPPFVTVVGLVVNEPAEQVHRILEHVPIDLLQFHGDESPAFCADFARPWLKAVRVRPGLDLEAEARRFAAARGVLLDSWREGVPGGTGETFDWSLVPRAPGRHWVLAGGLDENNVAAAIEHLQPPAVDLCSGVERSPGVKDEQKIRAFMHAVRGADARREGVEHG
jgi:phosphoribosylanthranilate isomerase